MNKQVNHKTSDNSLTEDAKASFKNEIIGKAVASGKRDAESGFPKMTGDKLLNYLAPLLSLVQGFLDKLRSIHLADETVALSLNKLIEHLKAQINTRDEQKQQLTVLESALQNIKDSFPSLLAWIIFGLLLAFSISDGLLSRLAIASVIGRSASLFVAIVFGISFAFLAHKFYEIWIKEGNKFQKLLRRTGLILFFTSLFFFLGMLRSYEINSSGASIEEGKQSFFYYVDNFQAFIHCFISWVFFLPSIILSMFIPTWKQIKTLFNSLPLKKEIKNLKNELKSTIQEINKTQEEIDDLEQYEYSRNKAAHRDETENLNLVPSIVSHYVQANNRNRRGEQPDCFDKLEKLDYPFTTYFQDQLEEETPRTQTSKKAISLLPKMTILLLMLFFGSCSKAPKVPILDLTICTDVTEGKDNKLTYSDVQQMLELDNYLWYEYNIKIKQLTEINRGLSTSSHLPEGNEQEELLTDRKQKVHSFLKQTQQMMESFGEEFEKKNQSILYKPIAEEINALARNSKATNKWLVIHSDLLEHSTLLNVYDKKTQDLLFSNPQKVIKQFQDNYPLEEDLTGITVIIVYHANKQDNQLHSKMAEIYQLMLNQRSAYVAISANYQTPKPLLP